MPRDARWWWFWPSHGLVRDAANGLSCDVGYEVAVAVLMQEHDLLTREACRTKDELPAAPQPLLPPRTMHQDH
jgi:hypothetical protein